MDSKTLLSKLEAYYSIKYPDLQIATMLKYLEKKEEKEHFGSRCREHLFAVLLKNYSGKFKTLPDIAVFEEYTDKALDELEAEQLRKRPKVLAIENNEPMADPGEVDEFFLGLREMLEKKACN